MAGIFATLDNGSGVVGSGKEQYSFGPYTEDKEASRSGFHSESGQKGTFLSETNLLDWLTFFNESSGEDTEPLHRTNF